MRTVRPAVRKSSSSSALYAALLCALALLVTGCLFSPTAPAPTWASTTENLRATETLSATQSLSPTVSSLAAQDAPAPAENQPAAGLATTAQTPSTRQTSTPGTDAAGSPQTLTVWVSEQIGPLAQGQAADVLRQQLAAFEATHPGLTIEVAIKQAAGPGGIENLLTTSSAVAPSVLPDLVALNTELLVRMARQGLTAPLEELISPEIQEDLYGLVHKAATVDGQWMGVQFQAKGLEHAIYNPNKIAVAPLTWTEVYSSGATYVFPAAGQEGVVNDAFLIQYLSTGASLVDEAGEPALDREALAEPL